MIVWDEVSYNIEKASEKFKSLAAGQMKCVEVNSQYRELRESLINARDNVFDQNNFDAVEKLGYKFDLTFGIEFYEILKNEFNFKLRDASNDDVWRFLQIEIIPDIVFSRWGLHEDRFYKHSRRLWLKTIWWYVHLSWNGSKGNTYALLQDNTTDTIMQLVERPGLGYNIELYREIMKRYGQLNDTSQYARELFRKVLIMNTARSITVSPELISGGIPSYVDDLFASVMIWG